jgi:hypothetical protein
MTATAGIPGTGGSAGPGGSGGSSASSPPSAESGGNAGSGAVSDGGGSAGSGLELDEIAESPAAGNLQGIWSLVSAHALEVGDGFQVRLYREPLPDSGEFVPTQNYVRLTVPVPGDFEVDLPAQNEDGLSATFVVCNQLGSPCVAAASMPEYATGRIVVQVDGSGLLNGGINLSSGSDAIDGSFAGVETYAAACEQNACQCNGAQLERCSWDRSSWLPTSCDEMPACSAPGSLQACCGGTQPNQ